MKRTKYLLVKNKVRWSLYRPNGSAFSSSAYSTFSKACEALWAELNIIKRLNLR